MREFIGLLLPVTITVATVASYCQSPKIDCFPCPNAERLLRTCFECVFTPGLRNVPIG